MSTTPDRTILVVDDDESVRDSLALLLPRLGYRVRSFESADTLLAAMPLPQNACVLADVRMPGMDGLALQREISRLSPKTPVIIMTGHGDIPMAVQAMKQGAAHFLEKPFERAALATALDTVFTSLRGGQDNAGREAIANLTDREREVFSLLAEGHQNKVIAHKLGISTRTVEVHRARVMEKLGARSIADIVRYSILLL